MFSGKIILAGLLVYLIITFIVAVTAVYGESSSLNLALPGSNPGYGSDKFRTGDLDCQNAIGSATQLEFGVTGIINKGNDPYNLNYDQTRTGDIGIYSRIIIPIGGPKSRINCDDLYQLELRKKQLEVMKLERELLQLRELVFETQE